MQQAEQKDTICALATPSGVGAIGIIRVSGEKSIAIVEEVFSKKLSKESTHTVHFGTIRTAKKEIVDEVLVTLFKGEKSFTGEESVEISCHGSPYVLQKTMDLLLEKGCRMAGPGEFSMRAFLNGKLDLSQAEAVADLIASQSQKAHELAMNQLRGKFSSKLKSLREQLIHFASLVELELDFAEEDVEFADRKELLELVASVLKYVQKLANSFELGNAIKNGVPVAIVGAPNTGKSTLLNQLLQDDRAIVSSIAGTTRDTIEEIINIDGVLFRFIDTAGIRENAEEVEAIGIEKSKQKIEQSKIVLCLGDVSETKSIQEVREWTASLKKDHPQKHIFTILNKADKNKVESSKDEILISAKSGKNIEELKGKIAASFIQNTSENNEVIVSNVRHRNALLKTAESLAQAKEGLETDVSADFVAMDIRQAMHYLGTITGQISEDDLLANIFVNFCIGK